MKVTLAILDSPIGEVHLAVAGPALVALDFGDPDDRLAPGLRARFGPALTLARRGDPLGLAGRVRAWFAGDLAALDGLDVDAGGTPFQRRVWAALRRIAPGETSTYGALAAALGRPAASRAVGLACGRNPVALVVPCHRVVGARGELTGYAGGLARKRWLLDHERRGVDSGGLHLAAPRLRA